MNRKIRANFKKAAFILLYHTGVIDEILRILTQKHKQHPCIIVLYHRIINDGTYFLNKGPAVHHHVKHFREEVAYLKRNFHILSMDELCDTMKAGSFFSRPSVVITFDDGYLDNYTLAYPVLKESGLPAIIYLTTGLIGTNGRTWTDQIEHALLRTKEESFNFPELFAEKNLHIRTRKEKARVNIKIAQALKEWPDIRRKELLQELFEILGVSEKEINSGERMMLNWDEVREMARNGITFGSHSHTHPILSRMLLQEAEEDILISKRAIEEQLGVKVKHFAYPNGRAEDFSEELRNYCKEIGFESVASVIYGVNDIRDNSIFSLRRVPATSPPGMFAGNIVKLLWKN